MELELPPDGDVKYWGIPQVIEWLAQNKMDVYCTDFQDGYIDGEKLLYHVDERRLRELNVHPKHCREILNAIQLYKAYNPTGLYDMDEVADDDEFNDSDEDRVDSEKYEPPDQPNATDYGCEDEVEPTEDYEEPDELPPPPPRPPKSHRLPPPLPKDEEPVSPPFTSRDERLSSVPDTHAPEPPNVKRTPRPPAPNPTGPKFSNISTKPVAPIDESLDDNYELSVDPEVEQENYEEVSGPPEVPQTHKPVSIISPRPPTGRPLPQPPTSDEDSASSISGGSLSSSGYRPSYSQGTSEHSPIRNKGKSYPLVMLPNEREPPVVKPKEPSSSTVITNSQPVKNRNKVIKSYEPHNTNGNFNGIPAPSVPPYAKGSPPPPISPYPKGSAPPLASPYPKPSVIKSSYQPPKPSPQVTVYKDRNNDSSEDVPGVTALGFKSKLALFEEKPAIGVKPPVSPKREDLKSQMEILQRQRKEKDAQPVINPPESAIQSVRKLGNPVPQSRNAETSNVISQKKHIHALPPLPPTPQQPSTSAPNIRSKPLPPTKNDSSVPPPIPVTERPSRRGSIDSETSSRSADEDRGLYSFSWYQSEMKRVDSIKILQRKRSNGAFIVRKSDKYKDKPYTLDVYYNNNIFHIQLRLRNDNNFAMGTYKSDEQHWPSIHALIYYFKQHNLALTKVLNGQTIRGSTLLHD